MLCHGEDFGIPMDRNAQPLNFDQAAFSHRLVDASRRKYLRQARPYHESVVSISDFEVSICFPTSELCNRIRNHGSHMFGKSSNAVNADSVMVK